MFCTRNSKNCTQYCCVEVFGIRKWQRAGGNVSYTKYIYFADILCVSRVCQTEINLYIIKTKKKKSPPSVKIILHQSFDNVLHLYDENAFFIVAEDKYIYLCASSFVR